MMFSKWVGLLRERMRGSRESQLHGAIRRGDTRAVSELLDFGLDPNALDRYGVPPLECAAASDQDEVIQLLLDRGADIDLPDRYGLTPLYRAAADGRVASVKALLDRGADPNVSYMGLSAIDQAVMRENVELVRLLLEHGADLNRVYPYDENEYRRQHPFLGRFVPQGADEWWLHEGYENPIERAAARNRTDLVEILLKHGGHIRAATVSAAREHRLDMLRLLLDRGADINASRGLGRTALMEAARRGYADVIRLLLERGARTDLRDYEGKTALDLARASRKGGKAVKILKQKSNS